MVHGVWPSPRTVAQLSLIGHIQGQLIVNVHHFVPPAANEAAFASDEDRQTWAAGLITDWRTNCKTAYLAPKPNDYTLDEYRVQVLEVPGQFEHRLAAISDLTGLPTGGTLAAVSDDLATCGVIRWRTILAGRHFRGRSYIGPLVDADVAQGRLAGGTITNLTGYVTAMSRYIAPGAGVTAGFEHVIYSRPYSAPNGAYTRRIGGVLTVVNSTTDYDGGFAQVSSGSVDAIAREQRRREIGVGS